MKQHSTGMAHAWAPRLVLALSCAHMLGIAYRMRTYFVDDAYIGFRYVDNLLSGNGFVFNPPYRVEGLTNIGWLLALTPFCTAWDVRVVAKIAGALLAVATVTLSYAIALRISPKQSVQIIALPIPFLVATHFDYVFFSMGGMETGLLSMVLCVIVYLALLDRCHTIIALLSSFAFLLHPECLVIYPIATIIGLKWGKVERSKHVTPLVVFAATIIAYSCARYAYYSDILPTTFHAKPTTPTELLSYFYLSLASLNLNISAPFAGLLALPFLAFGTLGLWKRFPLATAYLATIVGVGLAFSTYARPDWTGMGRYFAPYVPLALILLWKGLVDSHRKLFDSSLGPRATSQVLLAYVVLIGLLGSLNTTRRLSEDFVETYPGYVLTSKNLAEPCLWMRDNLPDDCIIATRRIGAIGYYSKKNIFDYKFGLTHREVARLIRANGRQFDNPRDPALAEIWKRVSPDYLVEDLPDIERMLKHSPGTLESFDIHGITYRWLKAFPIGKDTDWVLYQKAPPG